MNEIHSANFPQVLWAYRPGIRWINTRSVSFGTTDSVNSARWLWEISTGLSEVWNSGECMTHSSARFSSSPPTTPRFKKKTNVNLCSPLNWINKNTRTRWTSQSSRALEPHTCKDSLFIGVALGGNFESVPNETRANIFPPPSNSETFYILTV